MKASRYNFYSGGMVPEASGCWIHASQLPKLIRDEYVEPQVIEDSGSDDDEEDA